MKRQPGVRIDALDTSRQLLSERGRTGLLLDMRHTRNRLVIRWDDDGTVEELVVGRQPYVRVCGRGTDAEWAETETARLRVASEIEAERKSAARAAAIAAAEDARWGIWRPDPTKD